MIIKSNEREMDTAMAVAEFMVLAARTAPKGAGKDNLELLIISGDEKDKLADEMRKISKEKDVDFFYRDGGNIDESHVVVLLGTRIKPNACPNCGYCGFKDCDENAENNGLCAFNPGDLGIAIGSAVSIAANHRCDNRVMFSAGKTAIELGYFSKDVKIAYGIPLSISAKSPFFDRE